VTWSVTLWLTACAPAPPLAATVTTNELVDDVLGAVETLLSPLHPAIAPRNPAKAKNAQNGHQRFFLGHAKRKANPRVTATSERPACLETLPEAIRIAEVWSGGPVMLSTTVKGVAPLRLGCAGENVQADPTGSPEQLRETAPTNPKPGPGVSKTFVVPGAVPVITMFPGLTAI
jgi:hypothetical protein